MLFSKWTATAITLACSASCLPTAEILPIESDAISKAANFSSLSTDITNPSVMVNGAFYNFFDNTWVVQAQYLVREAISSSSWRVPTASGDMNYLAAQIATGVAVIYQTPGIQNFLERINIGGGWVLETQNFAYNSWPANSIPAEVITTMALSAMRAATQKGPSINRFGWDMFTSTGKNDIIRFLIYPQN
ncbi:hypothetical protein GGI35DRAFT_489199 [Trichoderma velutinum]